ncbi:hypothetical protein AGMMS4952_03270 [Spirochaetia bacterium]|nr:hypothetical protein AGMMS4952_03270 [Spirochaetia bacterium]
MVINFCLTKGVRRIPEYDIEKRRNTMAYTKPVVLAQNSKQGAYAAGCPAKNTGVGYCKSCERSQ